MSHLEQPGLYCHCRISAVLKLLPIMSQNLKTIIFKISADIHEKISYVLPANLSKISGHFNSMFMKISRIVFESHQILRD